MQGGGLKLLEVNAAEPISVFYQAYLKHQEEYRQNALSIRNSCFIAQRKPVKDMAVQRTMSCFLDVINTVC